MGEARPAVWNPRQVCMAIYAACVWCVITAHGGNRKKLGCATRAAELSAANREACQRDFR